MKALKATKAALEKVTLLQTTATVLIYLLILKAEYKIK